MELIFAEARDMLRKCEEVIYTLEDRVAELDQECTEWEWTAIALSQLAGRLANRNTEHLLWEVVSLAEEQTRSVVERQAKAEIATNSEVAFD